MLNKSIIFVFCIIFLASLVTAQSYKLEISTAKETFEAGEPLTLKVSIFDSQNNPINDQISITIEGPEKRTKIEKTIPSNNFVDIDLGEQASHGYWTITASYKDSTTTQLFIVEIQELAKFELNNDILTITNTGNTKYTKTIQIVIGSTVGVKEPSLNSGESVNYRLIAPKGVYNIKVTDGKTTLAKSDVPLTGNAIGILEEGAQISGLTGGIPPKENGPYEIFAKNKFIYIFVLVIFGAMILLAIERRYAKKAK